MFTVTVVQGSFRLRDLWRVFLCSLERPATVFREPGAVVECWLQRNASRPPLNNATKHRRTSQISPLVVAWTSETIAQSNFRDQHQTARTLASLNMTAEGTARLTRSCLVWEPRSDDSRVLAPAVRSSVLSERLPTVSCNGTGAVRRPDMTARIDRHILARHSRRAACRGIARPKCAHTVDRACEELEFIQVLHKRG